MPQRFLRPGLRTSERWNTVSFGAQSLYVSLLTLVDDFGRYDGRPALLHGECFSLRNPAERINPQRTAALLQELHERELIQLYRVEGKDYLQILRWEERARSAKSKYPDPPEQILRNPAESCGILPPSPSSSPSPVHHTPSGAPTKPPAAAAALPPSLDSEEFRKEWEAFAASRRRLGKPLTPRAAELILGKMAVRSADAVEAMQMAVERGWQGFEWTWFDDEKARRTGSSSQRNGFRPAKPVTPRKIDLEFEQCMQERHAKTK